ncbi:MAG: hypothetical protein MJ244_04185 [Clostridia bacterium]|nr:hypothetical protein [Clostridia bacterium]
MNNNELIFNDKKYILCGIIENKKENIYLGYNIEEKKTEFFEKKKNIFFKEQINIVNQKLEKEFNDVFNRIEEDLLFLDGNTLNKLDFSKLKNFDIDDDKYNEVFKQTVKNVITSIKDLFPECNLSNLEKRLPTLKVSVVDRDTRNYYASFSRWKNEIYISKEVFKSPKMLGNVICHEIFHLIGTETELTKTDQIKKGISRKTGFEGKNSFGKGLNEGFVQKYSNQIVLNEDLLTFEVRVSDMIEQILDYDLARDNSYGDTEKLFSLTKNKEKMIRFVKLMDNYHMLKTRYIDNKKISNKLLLKYNFISEIEKCLVEFFFDKLILEIDADQYNSMDEVYDKARLFKDQLIFLENLHDELGIYPKEVIDDFDSLKNTFIQKVKMLEIKLENKYIGERHKKELKLIKEIKRICKYTFNITDVFEILDESFKKTINLMPKEKVYLLSQKMDNKRKFYILVRNENNSIREILNDNIEIMKELKDATVYDNLNMQDEAREKERRYANGRTFSIFRKVDGQFGIADVVDKENKILRSIKTLRIQIPYNLIDDSLEDFSYLNGYVIPEYDIEPNNF